MVEDDWTKLTLQIRVTSETHHVLLSQKHILLLFYESDSSH